VDLKEVDGYNDSDEREHWWIKTRFCYIDNALKKLSLSITSKISVVEFGHGTGQNLWFLKNRSIVSGQIKKILGIDPLLPDNLCGEENGFYQTNDLLKASGATADLVLAMDVLEHIDDELEALKSWVLATKNGGVILLTVPAFMSLWSYHDEFLDHKRRYTKADLFVLANKCNLEVVSIKYAFSFLFLPVYIIRKIIRRKNSNNGKDQDLQLPLLFINKLMYMVGKFEAFLGGNPFFGTSVVGIFKVKEL
jgi:SAM-dependent methyltransferase